jgi:hypothetical protein
VLDRQSAESGSAGTDVPKKRASQLAPSSKALRQILYVWQDLCHSCGLNEREPPVRANRKANPIHLRRARAGAANLRPSDGRGAIRASPRLSVRRVQQIVRQEINRGDANPADDYALLQIARLKRALELIGSLDAARGAGLQGG